MSIRNIVFDMGGVLVVFDPQTFLDQEGITDPADRALIYRELFHSVEWAQMDLGVLEEQTAEPLVLSRIPDRLKDHVRHLLYHWADHREQIPGMEDLVRRLKTAGYGIYLLSNASTAQPHYWQKFPVSQYFDATLISATVRQVKPMDAIYQLFTERFGLEPDQCVFIDDMPINVAGAVRNGWQGIVFQGDANDLERKLHAMGVVF